MEIRSIHHRSTKISIIQGRPAFIQADIETHAKSCVLMLMINGIGETKIETEGPDLIHKRGAIA